jgi:radical SAM enzyme (TIGR01210 family)
MNSHVYPDSNSERDKWILARRPPRNAVDSQRPQAFFVEDECDALGAVVPVATIFLTNRECPWRCLMCDLWRNTLVDSVSAGAIPEQIDFALRRLPSARYIKLYNSGSFFDRRAIPPEDFPAIAECVHEFERVIVECHPALIGDAALRFRDLLAGRLEIAMGLETAHPAVLEKLNKRMTLAHFAKAAEFLQAHDISLRVFVLVKPPFLDETEAVEWARRSADFAFDCGTEIVSLIPTRPGNGALDALVASGEFAPPRLATLEAALDDCLSLRRGRVFADVWDLERFSSCSACFAARRDRLREMNLRQTILPRVRCAACES